jgi:hypothetical protein
LGGPGGQGDVSSFPVFFQLME